MTGAKGNESLQAFAMEVEGLVQFTYPGENLPLIDNIKTGAFHNGIRDPDIKLAVSSTQKTTFAETEAFALALETARTISRPPVNKVRKMKVVEEEESLLNELKEMLKQVGETGQKTKLKRVAISKEIIKRHGKDKRPKYQPSSQESPLN